MRGSLSIGIVSALFVCTGLQGNVHDDFSEGTGKWAASGGAVVAVGQRSGRPGDGAMSMSSSDSIGTVMRAEEIDPGQRDLWIDLEARPVLVPSGSPTPNVGAVPASFFFNEKGDVVVYDGDDSVWTVYPLGKLSLKPGKWVRISLALNYEVQRWTLWIDGKRVAANLGFAGKTDSFEGIRVQHRAPDPALLDDLGITFERPKGLAGGTEFNEEPTEVFVPVSKPVEKEKAPMRSLFVPLKR